MTDKFGAEAELSGADDFVRDAKKMADALRDADKAASQSGGGFDKLAGDVDDAGKKAKSSGGDLKDFGNDVDSAGKKASGASGDFDKAGKSAKNSGDDAEKGGGGWKAFAINAGGVAAGIGIASMAMPVLGGAMTSVIGKSMEFEVAMDAVGAVSGATDSQMDALGETALRLGESSQFGATETANAMGELAAQGVNAEAIINGAAEATLNLAAAGGTDLVTAATAASTAMNIWGLGTEDLAEVTNRLTGAANVSAFGVEDMTQGMASGGIAAKTFGISMEDTTTALAALSKGGFQSGSDAGTSFKAMLTGLAAPMGAGADAIEDLGINVRDAGGNMLPVSGIIEELQDKLGDLGKEDRDEAMARIFGTDGMRAASALMGLTGEEFEAMSATMESTDAASIAAKRIDNLSGSMDAMGGAIETAQIRLGQKLTPAIRGAVDIAAELIPILAGGLFTAMDKIGEVATDVGDAFQFVNDKLDMGEKLGDVVAAGAPALAFFTDLFDKLDAGPAVMAGIATAIAVLMIPMMITGATAVAGLATSFVALTIAMATNPLVLAAIAAGLLVAGIILVVKHWDELVEKFPILGDIVNEIQASWANLLPHITGALDAVKEYVAEAVAFLSEKWAELWPAIVDGAKAAGEFLIGAFNTVWPMIISGVESVRDFFIAAWPVVVGVVQDAISGIQSIWAAIWPDIQNIASQAMETISAVIELGMAVVARAIDLASAAVRAGAAVWPYIQSAVLTAVGVIVGFIQNSLPGIQTIVTGVWNFIQTATMAAWGAISGVIEGALQIIQGVVQVATGALRGDWSTAWEGIKNIASGIWTAISAVITAGFETIKALFTLHWEVIKGLTDIAWEAIKAAVEFGIGQLKALGGLMLDAGQWLLNKMWDGLKEIWSSALDWVTGLPGEAAADIKAGANLLMEAGQDLLQQMWDGAKIIFGFVITWVAGLPGEIVAALGDLAGMMLQVGKDAIQGFLNGMSSMAGAVKDKAGDIGKDAISGLGGMIGWGSPAKVFIAMGEDTARGYAMGLEKGTPMAVGAIETLGEMITTGFKAHIEEGMNIDELVDHFSDAMTEAGFTAEAVGRNISYVMDSMAHQMKMVSTGTVDMEGAIVGALWEIDQIMNGSQMTVQEWAQYFTDYPKNAAKSFSELNDSVRFNMGEILLEMDGFGAATDYLAEDFSICASKMNTELIGHHQDWSTFVDATADEMKRYAADVGDMGQLAVGFVGAMAQDMKYYLEDGRVNSKQNMDAWMADLKTSIQYADLPAVAKGEAEKLTKDMADALRASGGVVTAEVVAIMDNIASVFGMSQFQIAAIKGGKGIADALASGLTTAVPTIEEVRAKITAELATWGGTFSTEIRHGGRMTTDETAAMLASITATIQAANLPAAAEAKALAMVQAMVDSINLNGGRVLHGTEDMIQDIETFLINSALPGVAAAEAVELVDGFIDGIKGKHADVDRVITETINDWNHTFGGEIEKTKADVTGDWVAMVDSFGTTFDVEMTDFGASADRSLGQWVEILKSGLGSGRAQSTEQIMFMFAELNALMDTSAFPAKSEAMAREAFRKMIDEFRASGSIANAELIAILNALMNSLGSPAVAATAGAAGKAIGTYVTNGIVTGIRVDPLNGAIIGNLNSIGPAASSAAVAAGAAVGMEVNETLVYTIRAQLPPMLKEELNDAIRNGVDVEQALEDVLMQLPDGLAPITESVGASIGNALLDGARRAFKIGEIGDWKYEDFEPGGKYYDLYVGRDEDPGGTNEGDTWGAFWQSIGMDRDHANRQYRVNNFEWFAQKEDWEKLGFTEEDWNFSSDPRHGLVPTTSKKTNQDFGKTDAGKRYWALRGWEDGQMDDYDQWHPGAKGWYFNVKTGNWEKATRRESGEEGGKTPDRKPPRTGGKDEDADQGESADGPMDHDDGGMWEPILADAVAAALEDGFLDMADVLSLRSLGFDDAADLLSRSIAGLATMGDVLQARTLGLDALAELMMQMIAGTGATDPATLEELVAGAIEDGILSMGDVLALRSGGFGDVADIMARSVAGLATMADVLAARSMGLDALANIMLAAMAGLGADAAANTGSSAMSVGDGGANMPNGSNYVRMPSQAEGAGGVNNSFDFTGANFTGTPQDNAAAFRREIERWARDQEAGLTSRGIRG